jgi:hypothetical protein
VRRGSAREGRGGGGATRPRAPSDAGAPPATAAPGRLASPAGGIGAQAARDAKAAAAGAARRGGRATGRRRRRPAATADRASAAPAGRAGAGERQAIKDARRAHQCDASQRTLYACVLGQRSAVGEWLVVGNSATGEWKEHERTGEVGE